MAKVKPGPNHPWRRPFITRKLSEHIKQSIINPKVENWKVGGGMPSWNGKK
ncbi:hypothetical protein [Brevibacillus laterosporus]|uniref:hypothetical protein n=1 Tax=Brevibacillus laterosporus TaxID=1465 RepID=UPI003D1A20D1